MTMKEWIKESGHEPKKISSNEHSSYRIFRSDVKQYLNWIQLWNLDDYVVLSNLSGPSILLVERIVKKNEM